MGVQETIETDLTGQKREFPEVVIGRRMEAEWYISQAESGKDLGRRLETFVIDFLKSRRLDTLKETPESMWGRINCLPTATLVAINLLLQNRVFGVESSDPHLPSLYDFYTTGVLCQINDTLDDDGYIMRKGFPSFHQKSGETYHQFVVAFARKYGLEGFLLQNFSDVTFMKQLIEAGCVIIISVDNLFIRDHIISKPATAFGASKHAEIMHGVVGDSLVYTDVFNARDGAEWNALNLTAAPEQVNPYLTCPRKEDFASRAIVLFPKHLDITALRKMIPAEARVISPPQHPILSKFGQMSLRKWNETMLDLLPSQRNPDFDHDEFDRGYAMINRALAEAGIVDSGFETFGQELSNTDLLMRYLTEPEKLIKLLALIEPITNIEEKREVLLNFLDYFWAKTKHDGDFSVAN